MSLGLWAIQNPTLKTRQTLFSLDLSCAFLRETTATSLGAENAARERERERVVEFHESNKRETAARRVDPREKPPRGREGERTRFLPTFFRRGACSLFLAFFVLDLVAGQRARKTPLPFLPARYADALPLHPGAFLSIFFWPQRRRNEEAKGEKARERPRLSWSHELDGTFARSPPLPFASPLSLPPLLSLSPQPRPPPPPPLLAPAIPH